MKTWLIEESGLYPLVFKGELPDLINWLVEAGLNVVSFKRSYSDAERENAKWAMLMLHKGKATKTGI